MPKKLIKYEDIEEEIEVPVYIPYAHSERLKHKQVCKAFREKIILDNLENYGRYIVIEYPQANDNLQKAVENFQCT